MAELNRILNASLPNRDIEIELHLSVLTHLFPMHSFSIPWKHQKTKQFSDIFRE